MKTCTKCKETKILSEFSKDSSRKSGLQFWCKLCVKKAHQKDSSNIKEYQRKYHQANGDKLRENMKEYKRANPARFNAYSAKRRALKLQKTPPDVDYNVIKEIYENCPEGYEVDHYMPLSKGGHHTPENLRYLPVSWNRSKGTSVPPDTLEELQLEVLQILK